MPEQFLQWRTYSNPEIPEEFVRAVQQWVDVEGKYLTQLLWNRGIRKIEQLEGYLKVDRYQPKSAMAFGQEMEWAVQRLVQAYDRQEIVAIWGDFDADGVTSTAVLWDGLGQFFPKDQQLFYYIPNRFTESHGLSRIGIDQLVAKGCQVIITCDTGSTNLDEIQYAQSFGIDVIVTDHHTVPEQRPPVIAIVNPRYLPSDHPFASLSGVAVAYKLVEALYEALSDVPQQPLDSLLDLVAIGLIADLVELKGDCRYLAQRGIAQLQKQSNPQTATRPGITRLLELCKRSGDRPTDISFGLGPRINAVSRIQGDAHFCVELLTSQDEQKARSLADDTELANARRKALQKDVTEQVQAKLAQLDLSTTGVIVLWDEQWNPGVLGLVAGQIAQEYGRPTILLSVDPTEQMARGSARSTQQIDLYQLVKDQAHLLHRFGGHPFAAGLSLAIDNLPLFTQAINQRLLQQIGTTDSITPTLQVDLSVTVAELGLELYKELRWVEPCGMGNPIPRLLIQNCWFEASRNYKLKDWQGRKIDYIRTPFKIFDDSVKEGFHGIWWGHYAYEIPQGRCDAIVELENNTYNKRYEVRLVDVRPYQDSIESTFNPKDWLLDWRTEKTPTVENPIEVSVCPTSWEELQAWVRRAMYEQRPLAIAYPPPTLLPPSEIWQNLVGIAKYLSRTGKTATRRQLYERLEIGDLSLKAGFQALNAVGFRVNLTEGVRSDDASGMPPKSPILGDFETEDCDSKSPTSGGFRGQKPLITKQITSLNSPQFRVSIESEIPPINSEIRAKIEQFLAAVREEQFRRQYFAQIPTATLQAICLANARSMASSTLTHSTASLKSDPQTAVNPSSRDP